MASRTRFMLSGLALAGLTLASPLTALAQDAPAVPPANPTGIPAPEAIPAPAAPPASPPAAEAPPPPAASQRRLEKGSFFRLLGQEVKGPSDMVVAQFVNVLVDAEGDPIGAVLDYGGFLGVGKRRLAVAWDVISIGPSGIKLSLGREQLRSIPDFKEGEGAVLAGPPQPADAPAQAGETPAVQ